MQLTLSNSIFKGNLIFIEYESVSNSGTNNERLAKNFKVSKFYDRKPLIFPRFEELNLAILIQMQKIENNTFEFRPKRLFTHQKSNYIIFFMIYKEDWHPMLIQKCVITHQ